MNRGFVRRFAALVLVGSALGATGCGSSNTTTVTPDFQIHDTSKFANPAIDAPLGAAAKGGAQVARPPIR